MPGMSGFLEGLLSAPPAAVYVLVGLLVFGEAAVFVGFVLPGETAVVLGGVLASRHEIDLWALIVLVALSAIIGDTVGYEVGRSYGSRVLAWGPLRRHEERLGSAQAFLRQRGGSAVFLGRWTAFLRAVMPGLAGASRMPYGRFIVWNALGGIAWGTTFCLVGYLAGNSYEVVAHRIGTGGALVTTGVAVAALVVWRVRRRRSERPPAARASAQGEPDAVAGDQDVAGDARRDAEPAREPRSRERGSGRERQLPGAGGEQDADRERRSGDRAGDDVPEARREHDEVDGGRRVDRGESDEAAQDARVRHRDAGFGGAPQRQQPADGDGDEHDGAHELDDSFPSGQGAGHGRSRGHGQRRVGAVDEGDPRACRERRAPAAGDALLDDEDADRSQGEGDAQAREGPGAEGGGDIGAHALHGRGDAGSDSTG
jgi:membrane protein DedA with SNARE-associated domain